MHLPYLKKFLPTVERNFLYVFESEIRKGVLFMSLGQNKGGMFLYVLESELGQDMLYLSWFKN